MNHFRPISLHSTTLLAALLAALACRTKVPPPEADPAAAAPAVSAAPAPAGSERADKAESATSAATPNATTSAVASASTPPSASAAPSSAVTAQAQTSNAPGTPSDPLEGKFTLEDAVKGLPKAGKLFADMVTDAGTLKCELYEDKAPNTVANFVGLARGIRPFKDPKTGVWGKRPGYDNGVFHRIIKGFMIQGGDPLGTGQGEAGYVIPDEVWPGATHDRRGLLCMANRGKNTNSMQFFIMDGAARHLDGGYTIFGSCGPDSVIEKLPATEVRGDRAVNPPKIKKVTIRRGK